MEVTELTSGERLHLWRRREGYTQKRLAKLVKTSQIQVSRWERDMNSLPLAMEKRLARLEQLTLAEKAHVMRRRNKIGVRALGDDMGISHVSLISGEKGRNDRYAQAIIDHFRSKEAVYF